MTVATCTAAPLFWPLVVTTACKAPGVRPLRLVTVKKVAVEAVTLPVPVGIKITVLFPGVMASKLVPVRVKLRVLLKRFAVFRVTMGGGGLVVAGRHFV